MPVITLPATSVSDSVAARKARMMQINSGAIQAGGIPLGRYKTVVKTAVVYHNPNTGKDSFRCECEILDGPYKGHTTPVFTSTTDDDRVTEMLMAVGANTEENFDLYLQGQFAELLNVIQGCQAQITRVLKDEKGRDESKNRTNNWVVG